jgi:excisionase family DNA binding protein
MTAPIQKICEIESLIDIETAAAILGVRVSTIYAWVHKKKIPFIKLLNKSVRFRVSDLERWITTQEFQPLDKEQQQEKTTTHIIRQTNSKPPSSLVDDMVAAAKRDVLG